MRSEVNKRTGAMKNYVLRYGVFTVLAVMLAGLAWMGCRYTIRTKQVVTVLAYGDCCVAYIGRTARLSFHRGDTLTVSQTPYGDFSFVITGQRLEPASVVFSLSPCDSLSLRHSLAGNTIATGYVFTGRESLGRLIVRKMKIK